VREEVTTSSKLIYNIFLLGESRLDKSKAVAILFVGCFLLYLGIFGTSGFAGLKLQLSGTLIDSWATQNDGLGLMVLHPSSTSGVASRSAGAQSFTMLSTAIKITSCEFYMLKIGGPTGIGHAVLYACSGSYGAGSTPIGAALATSDGFDVSTLTTSLQWIPVTFSGTNQYLMQANTHYSIAFENPTSGRIDTSNFPTLGLYLAQGAPGHSGNLALYEASAWNGGYSSYDMCFTVYGGGGTTPTYSDVTISVSGQGSTVPAAGHYTTTYLVGGSLTITATPASGWAFDYMTRNGVATSSMTLTSLGAYESIVVYFKAGSPTTGTLRVFASYNGAYVVASVTAAGPQTVSGLTTTDSNNPLSFTVSAGTYTVSGTYSSGSASPVTVTVTAGGRSDASLNFGGSPPTPDFLTMIINLINSIAARSLFTMAGVACTGIGVIGLFTGRRKRGISYSPMPYY